LPSRGCKGATGTQASYLELFKGDHQKVKELDRRVAGAFDFERTVPVTGQTYSRKLDFQILSALSGVAQSAAKCATDVRLLQHEGEILEPFEIDQVGSSAMPYKRNPMRSERVCALARYTISLAENPAYTAATQWLERTLDDSANRRLVLADAFLSADATLVFLNNICSGLEVKEGTIRRNVGLAMPFMATERWLMLGVATGGDRQELHEIIRKHSLAVMAALENGAENDLVERLASDPAFSNIDTDALTQELSPERYVGRSAEQVQEFVDEWLDPLMGKLERFRTPDEASVTV
ncbi:MAG: lyase family protein, partial [Gemmatimonadales bacterium]